MLKKRHEKAKLEEKIKFEKVIASRDSEIEVLKGMVKGSQLQCKNKEKEVARLK